MTDSQQEYDLIIVGGGMVGASFACALGNHPLKVAIVEAYNFNINTPPSYDDRAIALSYGTSQIFRAMGIWDQLENLVTPIRQIHVSDRGHIGITRIDHQQENVDALGYVITARELGQVLYNVLTKLDNVHIISPAQMTQLSFNDDQVSATIAVDKTEGADANKNIAARLLVAADGGDSSVRQLLNIDIKQHDYQQTAITANVSIERPHNNIAYERFTSQGPLAMLPMQEDRCSLVWTRKSNNVEPVLALSDADFLQLLHAEFGNRLGKFTQVGKRSSYPLKLIKATTQVQKRVALIGNAAHTLHPIAGQGFNLGMRDVAALAQVVVDAYKTHTDIGLLRVLQPYQQWRQQDHQRIIGFTDNLVKIFSNRFAPIALARNLGLIATDTIPPIKHLLAQHTMGLAGKLPRLARGLPL